MGLDDALGLPFRLFAGFWGAKIGAKVKKVILNTAQHGVELRIGSRCRKSRHAKGGIGFIHRAIGFDAQVVFGAALARPQSRCALISGARVNTIENDQFFLPSAAQPKHAHDDQNGDELEPHAPAHQLLRQIGAAAPHHVEEAEKQHDRHGNGGGKNNVIRSRYGHEGPLDAISVPHLERRAPSGKAKDRDFWAQ